MEFNAIQAGIGLLAGLLGGLLGIGGSIIIIPGMVFYLSATTSGYSGKDQHLLQAAAMICNFAVAAPSVWVHSRAGALMRPVVVRLLPSALIGIVLGVMASNTILFARQNGRYLAMGLAGFLVYVVIYNSIHFLTAATKEEQIPDETAPRGCKVIAVGLPMGFMAGLLGIGGGVLCVPAQQLFLRIPLRQAIANSAATIACIALVGALYKNVTLAQHHVSMADSLRLAAMLIPTAMAGSFIGGKLTHCLPRQALRMVLIVVLSAVIIRLFTVALAAK
jgi:uncharacterized protein